MSLLERWVSDLERDTPFSTQEPTASRPRNPAAPSRSEADPFSEPKPRAAPSRSEADPFSEPKPRAPHARSEADPVSEPKKSRVPSSRHEADPFSEPKSQAQAARPLDPHIAALRAAREEIQLQGMVATLPPAKARVVLGHENGRLVHRGTVAVRGPCAPSHAELLGLGLAEPQARALDCVLAWFGNPFDAVTWDSPSGVDLRWGAWPLSGDPLIAALACWKQREPEAFDARLGRLGIDVTLAPPTLRLQGSRGAPDCEGREALALLGEDPRLMASLAQAGRERGAQLAQLKALLAQVLRPLLSSCSPDVAGVEAPPEGPFSTARALAVLFHVELRFGRRGVTKLMAHARERAGQPASGEFAGERLAEDLRTAGRAREAAELWRLLSSPELADLS